MQTTDKTRTSPRPRKAPAECCADLTCESGLRNNYYEGKRLTPDSFKVEQRYLIERRQLLNRAIHGWGVVYGYAMKMSSAAGGAAKQLTRLLAIGPGLALDACGRELLYGGESGMAFDSLIPIDDEGRKVDLEDLLPKQLREQKDDKERVCWVVSVHYAEQSTDGVRLSDGCRCERHEWDHICETVRFTLRRIPCDDCCAGCDCDLHCDCGGGSCCDSHTKPVRQEPEKAPSYEAASEEQAADVSKTETPARIPASDEAVRRRVPFKRGGGRCLCDYLAGLAPGDDCSARLCDVDDPCARVRVDLKHGVPLACITLESDNCGGWTFGPTIDDCGPRRLVKRNDLLYDLVRGCDLTRICRIGWGTWHRQTNVPFDKFSAAFGPIGHQEPEYTTRLFWVEFSRPVREDTLLADCFAMTVMSLEREGNWRWTQRVPILRIDTSVVDPEQGDPPGHVRGARVVVEGGWVEDALRGAGSVFFGDTWIEIEVRGDFIIDCNGQPVDANAVGLSADATGNGTPGGTFLSTFQVAPREPYPRRGQRDLDRLKGASS
jgi:hypothetical protein